MVASSSERSTLLKRQIRGWIVFVGFAIIISGVTAFPMETELKWLQQYRDQMPADVDQWLKQVFEGIRETNQKYPFLAYGYDWLAFAHIVIAISLFGPFRDPVKNVWIIEWNMICCVLVFPLALIAGPSRHIPFFHQVVDCSFGLIGLIPLIVIRKKINEMERLGLPDSPDMG